MLVSGQASCEAFGKLTAKPQPLWFSPLAALWHLPLPARTLHINPVDFETGSLTKQSFYSTNNSKLRSTNVFSSEAPFPSSPPAKQLHFPSFWTSEIRKKTIHMSVPIQLPSYKPPALATNNPMKHVKLSIKTTGANSISRALHLDKSAAILSRDSWAQRTRYTASFNWSIPCLGNPVSYQTNSTRSSLQLVFTTPLQLLPKKMPRKSTGPSVAHKKNGLRISH